MPRHVFYLQVVYLGILLGVFAAYQLSSGFADTLPDTLGSLPVGVPWFGAVGGVLISFTGTFKHNRKWDVSYNYRHYSRPLIGAVIGSIGALIFFVVVETATTRNGETNNAVYYVVAFLLGYREETFRELIKRATDLLLSPGRGRSGSSPDSGPPPSA